MSWKVYIIFTRKGRLYTGITTDLKRRFQEHLKDRKKGAKFFRSDKPMKIVFEESYDSRSEATKRECQIKQLDRTGKEALIVEHGKAIKG